MWRILGKQKKNLNTLENKNKNKNMQTFSCASEWNYPLLRV